MKELKLKWKQKRKDIAVAHENRFCKWVRRSGKKWHWTFKNDNPSNLLVLRVNSMLHWVLLFCHETLLAIYKKFF